MLDLLNVDEVLDLFWIGSLGLVLLVWEEVVDLVVHYKLQL